MMLRFRMATARFMDLLTIRCLIPQLHNTSAQRLFKKKPRKPREPDVDRCCAKDCKNCFLNDYFDKMEDYEEKMLMWKKEQEQLKAEDKEKTVKKTRKKSVSKEADV